MAIVRNPRPRSHSTGLVIENRYPTAAAGTRTIARNEAQTIARTNALRGLYPRRSRSSGTTRNGTRTATMVAATMIASRQTSTTVTVRRHARRAQTLYKGAHNIFDAVWPIDWIELVGIADHGYLRCRD